MLAARRTSIRGKRDQGRNFVGWRQADLVRREAWNAHSVVLSRLQKPFLFQRIPPEIHFACESLVVLAAGLLFRLLVDGGAPCAPNRKSRAPFGAHLHGLDDVVNGILRIPATDFHQ